MQDYYEVLQVHPRADQEAIDAAYARLRALYDPQRLEGAADELVAIARERRDLLDAAYAVLGDVDRRQRYDALQEPAGIETVAPAADITDDTTDAEEEETLLDYRPLPPARGQERPAGFDAQPNQAPLAQRGRRTSSANRAPSLLPPAIVAGITLVVLLTGLIITDGGRPPAASTAVQASPAADAEQQPTFADLLAAYDNLVTEAQQAVDADPANPQLWIDYGNALYDSVQIVFEAQPESELYISRIPRWLAASDAYQRALELQPDNPNVRSERGVTLCNYGSGVNDPGYVQQGLQDVQSANAELPDQPRILLNLGVCMVASQPPQTAQAIEHWQQVLQLAPADSGLALQAQRLIERYAQ